MVIRSYCTHIWSLHSCLTFSLYWVFRLCRCVSSHGNQAYWETPPSVRSNTFDRQLWKKINTINIYQCNTRNTCNLIFNIQHKLKSLKHLWSVLKPNISKLHKPYMLNSIKIKMLNSIWLIQFIWHLQVACQLHQKLTENLEIWTHWTQVWGDGSETLGDTGEPHGSQDCKWH